VKELITSFPSFTKESVKPITTKNEASAEHQDTITPGQALTLALRITDSPPKSPEKARVTTTITVYDIVIEHLFTSKENERRGTYATEAAAKVQMRLRRDKSDDILREGGGVVELSVDEMVLSAWSPGRMFPTSIPH
jgi:hypothetical protein